MEGFIIFNLPKAIYQQQKRHFKMCDKYYYCSGGIGYAPTPATFTLVYLPKKEARYCLI